MARKGKYMIFDPNSKRKNVICLGAHSDDIELGCGGALLRMSKENQLKNVKFVVMTGDQVRVQEAKNSLHYFSNMASDVSWKIDFGDFPDGRLPYHGVSVRNWLDKLLDNEKPDLIFTHQRDDAHQDHRFISNLTYNIFRNDFILEYEILKTDIDQGQPNFFIGFDKEVMNIKSKLILESFVSQNKKKWFNARNIESLAAVRSVHANNKYEYSEGFYCRKFIW